MSDKQFVFLTVMVSVLVVGLVLAFGDGLISSETTVAKVNSLQEVEVGHSSSSIRDQYMEACIAFMRNDDASEPCSCMYEGHSMGGDEVLEAIIPYYKGEVGLMEALSKSAELSSQEEMMEMQQELAQCQSSWTADKGWH